MFRIGVLGASFNPPTKGHADVVQQALSHFDEILLVPSVSHAFEKKLVPLNYRLEMLERFISQWPTEQQKIKIVNIEAIMQRLQNKPEPIYTYNVLNVIHAIYECMNQPFEIKFIVGPDNAQKEVWQKFYRYQEIEKRWSLFVAEQNIPVHSTQIRELCKLEPDPWKLSKLLKDKLPGSIIEYILNNNLYMTDSVQSFTTDVMPVTKIIINSCVFKLEKDSLSILLEKAVLKEKTYWGLPFLTFMHIDQNLEAVVANHLLSLLGFEPTYFEQAMTESYPEMKLGGQVNIVYYGLCFENKINKDKHIWADVNDLKNLSLLPFHDALIAKCIDRLQSKSLYTSLPVFFLKEEFTLTELQKAFEVVLGFKLEKKSFRRRFLDANILVETGKHTKAKHRPAQFYRLKRTEPYVFPRIIEGVRKTEPV